MGFASGFQTGFSVARMGLQEREKRKLQEQFAAESQRTPFDRYTPEQGEQMRADAAATDQYGRQKYRFEIDPGSTEYRRVELDYGGAPQQVSARQSVGLQPSSAFTPAPGQTTGIPTPSLDSYQRTDFAPEGRYELSGDGGAPVEYGDPWKQRMAQLSQRPLPPVDQSMYAQEPPSAASGATAYQPAAYGQAAGRPIGPVDGDTQRYAPGVTQYLNQQYERGTLTPERQRAALYDQYASILEKAGKPEEAMQMRAATMGLRKNTLEMENLESAAEKAKSLKQTQKDIAGWWKNRIGDRAPTNDDFSAMNTYTAAALMQGGHIDEANAAADKAISMNMNLMKQEAAQRDLEIPKSVAAIMGGDVTAGMKVYDQFIHDGARTTGVTRGENGAFTVHRELLDGTKLPDHTFQSPRELAAYVNELRAPGSAEAFAANMFKQNIQAATLELEKRKTAADEKRAGAAVTTSQAHLADVTRGRSGDWMPMTDAEGNPVLYNVLTGQTRKAEGLKYVPKGSGASEKDGITLAEKRQFDELSKTQAFKDAKKKGGAAFTKYLEDHNLDPLKFGAEAARDYSALEE